MDEPKISYLIIGNGIAGVTAAETLRAEDPQASIGVIADDQCPVYYRPALKDYLGGHIPTEKLWARPTNFYRDRKIAFLRGHVIGLDSQHHTVLLQSHKQVHYHKVLLANGASPARLNCPGNDLHGVTTLRTVTDYQNVQKRLGDEDCRRVVVCGSGTLALETVESLRQRGLEVTHLLRHATLWSEVLDATASDLVLQQEQRAGVEVCREEEIAKIVGAQGEVSGVVTSRKRHISCQMVLIAIGIEPNIKPWLAGGVSCGRGVRVDGAMRTNLPDIYAAGDLIETRDRLTNRTRVLGQWYPAIHEARVAAYSMLGHAEEVEPFYTDAFYNATFLYGLDFASAGLTIMPDQPGHQELVADPEPRSYRKVVLKDGIPVGLLALGDRKQALALKRAIDHRVNLLSIANRLFSADFNLRTWLDQQGVPPPRVGVIHRVERAITQKVSTSVQDVGDRQAQGQPLPPYEVSEEKMQSLIISGEQIGGEEMILDTENSGQVQGLAPMNHEALLAHIVDPALGLHIPETPLNLPGGRQAQGQPLRIGRQAGVHLLLDEGSISRQHAEISYSGEYYLLQDLGSTNGTFVNEQRLEASRPYILQPNDVLRFGNIVRLKFLLRVLSYQSSIHQNDRRDNASRLPDQPNSNQYLTEQVVQRYQEQRTIGQAVLNPDGTLSTPGNVKPVAAAIVEQLKQAPALVIIPEGAAQKGIPPQIHFLDPGQRTTIGREEDNDIVLTDATASRYHAEVFLDNHGYDSQYLIRDLVSTYGTLVNQTKILAPHLLSHSDRIKLGSTRIFFIDLQAGKEVTTRLASAPLDNGPAHLRQGTHATQNNTVQQTNITICPSCGVANAHVARFCASCSTLL